MNLLIIGDRKPLNDSDLALSVFRDAGHDTTFLYRGPEYPLDFGIPVEEGRVIDQIGEIVSSKSIDVIYFRVDWFDKLYTLHGRAILDADFGVPIVFGYHCHTCCPTDFEAHSFANADALILLNAESQGWFESRYAIQQPTRCVPSLFLPKKDWYDVPLASKLSKADGRRHVVIPSNVLRVAAVPEKLDPAVPIESAIIDRYDYVRLIEQLAKRELIVHVYGKFAAHNGQMIEQVERAYRALASQYPTRVHFHGRVDQAAFATELSQYDAALLTGYVPYQPVPKFDHMNYQIRMNPVLAARLPMLIASGTGAWTERELKRSGAGFVFNSFENLAETLKNEKKLLAASEAAVQLQASHNAEAWVEPMTSFFAVVVESYQNRSSSQAA